ncbi:hypothetical protein Agub_g7687 [Astrephomene gubernaculifera]|uniref:Uncharacterized protein n=1 Tax=Astrephomene gubernaculifera TaxID=47775 RepID=A0AAD3HLV8_9CHLO|nr:hypothetical protein Agub_g7687 [Astrephomene gubernaculifera]
MSSDEDAEELAALRAQRAARTGGAATLSQLRELQRRAEAASIDGGDYFEVAGGGAAVGPPKPPAAAPQGASGSSAGVAAGGSHGPPRPPGMGGGGGGSDGPPRPPSQQQGQQQALVGPPRPPPRQQQQEEEGGSGEEGEAEKEADGGRGWSEEPDRMDDPVRACLPMSFGAQEKKVANPIISHNAFRRGGSGSPPPPSAAARRGAAAAGGRGGGGGGGGSFGPPRPPSAAAQRQAEGGEEAGPSVRGPGGGEEEGEEGDGLVGPPRPPPGSDEEEEEEGDEGAAMAGQEEEEDDPYGLPITHEAILRGHTKAVTCLDVEHSGTRMVTGSHDYTVRIYDFHGMKSDMRSFRDVEASEGHPVLSVSWSPSGEAFLVVTGAAQAKLYDRDGRCQGEFVRGDMYIRDARNTRGHVSGLTGGWWHPTDRYTALTSSEDGTVRIWDTHNVLQKTVIKPSLARPVRTAVTAVSYNTTGSLIGAGLADGTVQVWSVGGKFGVSAAVGQVLPPKPQMVEKQGWTYVSRPNQLIRDAHVAGTEISSLCFSSDNTTLLSRGTDGTLKIWDLRRFQTPVHVHSNLPAPYAQTRAIFSPDESLILTGTGAAGESGAEGGSEGALVFFSRAKNELIRKVGMPGNVTALSWHPRLNQIFVGIGSRKMGETHALYDLTRSEKGVLGAASRRPRAPNPLDFTPPLLIKTPHALPMYRDDPVKKRKAEREAAKQRRPDLGMVAGRGKQGRLGATGGTLLTQHLLKQRGGLMAPEQEMDPREAILRHADKAKDEFAAWTAAYRATQPKPVYAQEEQEEEGEE